LANFPSFTLGAAGETISLAIESTECASTQVEPVNEPGYDS
jgi:hypothetical protein